MKIFPLDRMDFLDAQADDFLTPTEAALVAGVSLREVNRVFDEHLLPAIFLRVKRGRWLSSRGCAFVSFYFGTASRLTADERTRIMQVLAHDEQGDGNVVADEIMTVKIDSFVKDTAARYDALRRAREAVVEDPEILNGAPVLAGTRILVRDVAAAVRAGQSVARIKEAYPNLDEAKIDLATIYADAYPSRGRPRSLKASDGRLTLISERRVARRRAE